MEPTNQNTQTPTPTTGNSRAPVIIIGLLILLAALIAGVIYWSEKNNESSSQPTSSTQDTVNLSAEISGEAEPSSLSAEEVVRVSVYVDTPEPVNAVGAVLTYPTDSLEFQSIDTSTTDFPTVASSEGGSGTVKVESGIAPGSDPLTGKKLLAVIQFKSLSGTGEKELNFVDGTQVISSETFKNILGTTQNVKIMLETN